MTRGARGWTERLEAGLAAALTAGSAAVAAAVAGSWKLAVLASVPGLGWLVFVWTVGRRTRGLSKELTSLSETVRGWSSLRDCRVPPSRFSEVRALVSALEGLKVEEDRPAAPVNHQLTRSSMLEALERAPEASVDGTMSVEVPVEAMVNRLDPEHLRWLASSEAEQRFLGWRLEELRRRSFLEVVRSDQRELARAQIRQAAETGEALGLVYGIVTARGEPRAVEVNVGARYAADGSVLHLRCHLTDVTERLRASRDLRRRTRQLTRANDDLRRANLELKELKDRYSDLYDHAPVMYFAVDNEGRFVVCNQTMTRVLGYAREELIGRSYVEILPEPEKAAFAERFACYLRQGSIEIESRWITREGSVMDVWIKATAVRDERGEIRISRTVATDITHRKRLEAELRQKNEQLERKNLELDQFSHVVSHDLREPARTILAFARELVASQGERLDEAGKEQLELVSAAALRMRAMIDDLLSLGLAGRVLGSRGPVDLEEVIGAIQVDFSELLRTRNAEVRVLGPLPLVQGDRARLGQLLANLIGNGLKYNRSERPVVEVSGAVVSDGVAEVRVSDNGIGIDPKHHRAVFQLFRRLHAMGEYEGTGAGLAICRKIVEAHGGSITVGRGEAGGSVFRVRLPTAGGRETKTGRAEGRPVQRDQYPHGDSNPGPQAENLVS